ncbi:protein-methionine-sulfoxide reductase heme-binding subunit MsrQ [Shimia marina]|uniref:Protein-methionine-sulfoxide reductase heme-binding subunit MsrQ n=1 Tax=Shimia marina TaxID=321267 RepID=A0A0P1ERK6_9RHOB|nr:protein-methionine-sulfoxide reductase heme-binding subunit MsrQ [Shimia marina]CUH52665.1 Flavocytochrome YedZ [Shimia marina]SFE67398.1 sulfoxide reductase heme-binding subunit YedZ [Shimia marina]
MDRLNRYIRKIPGWLLYLIGTAYPVWLLYAAFSGDLGVDPVKAMEHALGKTGLQVLVAVLAISPLRRFAKINLLSWRRALGVIGFAYILLHFLVWMVLDVQILSQVWADIVKRPYIIVGMVSLMILLPLALTSNNWSVRKLGARWRLLHKATYGAVLLGGVHYIMQVKSFQYEPYVYLAVIVGLIALRRLPKKGIKQARKPSRPRPA